MAGGDELVPESGVTGRCRWLVGFRCGCYGGCWGICAGDLWFFCQAGFAGAWAVGFGIFCLRVGVQAGQELEGAAEEAIGIRHPAIDTFLEAIGVTWHFFREVTGFPDHCGNDATEQAEEERGCEGEDDDDGSGSGQAFGFE
ncbi:MAG: hypothetical protein RI897_3253 [Verrucomicrobiota bacterium]